LALQGTLDTFSLPDVLRLLATTSKTGRLRIDGDRGRGNVWLSDGGVVDADADRTLDGTPVDEVVFELLRFESGNFAFDGDDTAAAGGKPEDVEALLRRANALLGEWNELEAVVPSLEHEVTLAGDLSADEVTISADSWQSLVAVSSGRTVGELATALGLTELGVSRAVRDLVELGVVDVTLSDRPRPAPVPAAPRDDRARRSVRPDTDAPAVPDLPAAPGHSPRASWLAGDRTGEMPTPPAHSQGRQPYGRRARDGCRPSRGSRAVAPEGRPRVAPRSRPERCPRRRRHATRRFAERRQRRPGLGAPSRGPDGAHERCRPAGRPSGRRRPAHPSRHPGDAAS
jgi:hypothetical protein